jgi:hypothetical protein
VRAELHAAPAARSCARAWQLAWLWLAAACASAPATPTGSAALPLPERSNYRWVSAQCVDGALDLALQGFERTLLLEQAGSGLRVTYETRLAKPACESTEVWSIKPEKATGLWAFVPDAEVRLPPDAPCGAPVPVESGRGLIMVYGETLEELRFSSPWCRGFDVRFIYHRIPAPALTQHELVRRYIAHWNRRDPRAMADLFASNGAVIEPFSLASDGLPVRHEGRVAIATWLQQAFSSVPWSAIQLREIETLDERGQVLALWRYYDPKLAEPLMGRNLFVLAGDEVFTTELQLLSEPVPASEASVLKLVPAPSSPKIESR